ncbi:TetR/AcrR family transcriptional regulator [Myxococcota bacterium]|nr:TetR/AcrR family transcriptional regulator [Myxococcota bacterium]
MVVRSSETRRERAREQARQDILGAAAAVFAVKGYEGATMADLAEASGFAAPSLYRYFASKEEIFRSLVEQFVEGVEATFEAPVDRKAPLAARLEGLMMLQARHAAGHAQLIGVLSTPIAGLNVVVAGRRVGDPASGIEFYRERFLAWLKKNTSRRELRHPPERVATAFAGLVFATHVRIARAGDEPDTLVSTLVDLALHGFARTPSASTE